MIELFPSCKTVLPTCSSCCKLTLALTKSALFVVFCISAYLAVSSEWAIPFLRNCQLRKGVFSPPTPKIQQCLPRCSKIMIKKLTSWSFCQFLNSQLTPRQNSSRVCRCLGERTEERSGWRREIDEKVSPAKKKEAFPNCDFSIPDFGVLFPHFAAVFPEKGWRLGPERAAGATLERHRLDRGCRSLRDLIANETCQINCGPNQW